VVGSGDFSRKFAGAPGELPLMEKIELMFIGQYPHAIDEKGRLTIPSRFRDQIGEGAVITRGYDKNLMVMTEEYFSQVYEIITAMNIADPGTRELSRMILGNAFQVEVDKAGRILVPQNQRQFLGLESEAVVVGQGRFFEVWAPADWQAVIDKMNDTEALAARISTLNLAPQK
jgi:MraZ protein